MFLFVAPAEVQSVAERFSGAPFDIEGVYWSHRGERCTFDVMVEEFGLATAPLCDLAALVRGADTARLDLAPEAAGLLAASLGLSRMYSDDLEQLEAGMTLYDAFYRWARDATGETHNWPTNPRRNKGDRLTGRPTPAQADFEGEVMWKFVVALLVLLVLGARRSYRFALPGLSSARPNPPKIEMEVATWLLRNSVPAEAAARVNPLKPDEATIAAGAATFQQKCAVCHNFDGTGHTTIGEHVYPRVPALRRAASGADGRSDFHLHQ